MHNEYFIKNYHVVSFLDHDLSSSVIDQYNNDELTIIDAYKNKKRGLVAKFKTDLLDGEFTIKVPQSRSNRIWERFLTLFRPGESIRLFNNFIKLQNIGFKGPSPLLAAERRRYGVVVEGFIIYHYIDGRRATSQDAHMIAPVLLTFYSLGYTRNDPKPNNFLISPGGDVYFIDFKLNKPIFFNKTRCLVECCKFLGKVPGGYEYLTELPSSNTQFKLALFIQKTLKTLRKIRRFVTGSQYRNS